MTERCRFGTHSRPCGPVPGAEDEPICACGCSGYDEFCNPPGYEWWQPGAGQWTAQINDLIGGAIVTTYPHPASAHDERQESKGGVPWQRGYTIADFMTMEDAEEIARLLNEAGIERKTPYSL